MPDQETLETVLQHINKPPKPISQFTPHIDPRVAEVIMKGLQTNPTDRWQTMSEMLIPLRKAHEEIEAKRQMEQKLKAASAKAKAAKTKDGSAAVAAKAQKAKEDDDFFEQILFGEGTTKVDKPKTIPTTTAPPKEKREESAPTKPRPTSSKPAEPKAPVAKSNPNKTKTPAPKPIPKSASPDIVIEDEFDGIEIEVEGHKLDAVAADSESADEFDGIEIESELPVETESPLKPSDVDRKFSTLLTEEAQEANRVQADAPLADDGDEPVLRLPDDD